MSNDNDNNELELRVELLMRRINERLRQRNIIYNNETDPEIINTLEEQNERLKDILLRISNQLRDLQLDVETNREISEVERTSNEGSITSFREEDINEWWNNEEKLFFYGKYRIVYSKFGIEKIIRIANVDGEKDSTVVFEDENINGIETFNNPSCVLCLDENKKPNILFCNCGHLCICEECNNIYQDSKCPICKIEITIKRRINNIK